MHALRKLLLGALQSLSPHTCAGLCSTFGGKSIAAVAELKDAAYDGPEQPSNLMHAAGAALAHVAFKAPPAYKDLLGPFAGPGGRDSQPVSCIRAQFARATSCSMAQV